MKPLTAVAMKQLKLRDAILNETRSTRNLLPTEPGWDRINAAPDAIVRFCTNQLKAGFLAAPQTEVAARKPGHGVRPVPYWGPLERVVYRALTDALLKGHRPLDRSAEAYLQFVRAPVRYANDLQQEATEDANPKRLFYFLESPIKYVVKSDITAFYQFVDHAVLGEELLLHGADFELIEALMSLLEETQGRKYGLPQLFDASDALSELYIDRVERDLLRAGLAVWRFNDDFRIACLTYADALAAIEAIDRAARSAGLVISENKTVTIGFERYLLETLGKTRSEVGETISPDEVEDVIGDYTDDFGEDDADAALEVLQSARAENVPVDGINLRTARNEQVRVLRRALNGLAKARDGRGIAECLRLVIFVPSLTPTVMRYVVRVSDDDVNPAATFVDEMMENVAQNEWQRLWLVDTLRQLELLNATIEPNGSASRVRWVAELRQATRNPSLRAATTRALASVLQIEPNEVMKDAELAPPALLGVYTTALVEARDSSTGDARSTLQKQIDALKRTSILHDVLLTDSAE